MRRILPLALAALAACFHDAGPAEILPATMTGTGPSPLSSTGLADGSGTDTGTTTTTTTTTTTAVTTTAVTSTDLTTGSILPFCGDAVCGPDEDCDGCAEDCGCLPQMSATD